MRDEFGFSFPSTERDQYEYDTFNTFFVIVAASVIWTAFLSWVLPLAF